MDIHAIPFQDKFIIYRPLRRLAFVGNRAMADLALRFAALPSGVLPEGDSRAISFLKSIGFAEPDQTPPAPVDPQAAFKPTSAALLMTGRCNLRCIYCYAGGGEKEALDLPLEAAISVIDQVYSNAVELGKPSFEVTFHGGGEPSLAWETLVEAAAYARSRGLPAKLQMVSNGVWNQAHREWVIANLDGLTISMDGGQATQDVQRPFPTGKGSFNPVMQTIRCLDQAKFSYNIRVTTTPERFRDLPEDVEFFCRETGCENIQVEPSFHSGRGPHHAPTPSLAADFSEAFLSAYDTARAAGRFMFYSGARPWLLTGSFCSAPLGSTLTINPHGEIVACYEITNPDHPLAEKSTFGQRDSFTGALQINEQRRSSFLNHIHNRQAACRDCFCYWHCAGDCYTRAFEIEQTEGQSPYARCAVNQTITTGLLLRAIADGDGVFHGDQIYLHKNGSR